MMKKRKYNVIIGSSAYFDHCIQKSPNHVKAMSFMELIKQFDLSKSDSRYKFQRAAKLIIKNNSYNGIVLTAHDRLGPLIEEITTIDAEVYVHNPPRILNEYVLDLKAREEIEFDLQCQEYAFERDQSEFAGKIKRISANIIGQSNAIKEMSKSLWYLTTTIRKKPYVIMMYGNSSLGKTELVREIANNFYNGKCLEKHLSMFKNNTYSDYFFGNEANRRSIGFDLLERESNLVFFDELDKCPEYFYSAFYTLFDNTLFKDATYDVDISGVVIVLTSNYHTEQEIKDNLGLPIYYRIDKFVHFNDFDTDTIYSIVMNEINSREEEYKGKITPNEIYTRVSPMIGTKGENARTIKYKIQQTIEELLFKEIEDEL